jgi:hypothetical protein
MSTEMKSQACPTVTASFSGYDPPFDVVPIVRRMLDSVPDKYLVGLGEVVLTNASGLPRKLRRSVTKTRGRKEKIVDARGLYHQEWQGQQARIEIFVDNALKGWERGIWLKIPFIREGRIGDVLFHEIGHHIHYSIRPEFREREDVADMWMVRLQTNYSQKRFRWFARLVRSLRPLLERPKLRLMSSMLKKGWISRGEYDESVRKPKIK